MKFTVTDSLGRIWRTGDCPPAQLQHQAGPGQRVHDGEYPDEIWYYDLGTEQFCLIPDRPAGAQRWDSAAHTWRADLAKEQADALARIEAARIAATTAPILHGGTLVDADATAHANLSSKLLELQQCAALGLNMPAQLLLWRDADNVTHTFDDAAAYAAWLGALAVAIARRGTAAYAWAWAQKAAVAAASAAWDAAALAALPTPFEMFTPAP